MMFWLVLELEISYRLMILSQKEIFISNLIPLVFLAYLFNILAKLFVVIYVKIIIFFLLFPSFIILVVSVCFCGSQNLGHPQTKMPHQSEFLLRIFGFENVY